MFLYLALLVISARNLLRSRRDLDLENITLRYQLAVLARPSRRQRLRPADRLILSWLTRCWPGWRSALLLVQPDTVVRWHRTAWRSAVPVAVPCCSRSLSPSWGDRITDQSGGDPTTGTLGGLLPRSDEVYR